MTAMDEEAAAVPSALHDSILAWYDEAGRELPFRSTRDPYAILVSEAMAQQTQAARAGEAWTRFMDAFPTVASLAAATPADVLRAWQGLGYNRRALNLWRAARRIVEVHSGTVPADLKGLRALPGVGPYTARAVGAIAFGMPVGAVDTNVRRVLGRIVAGDPTRIGAARLQVLADATVPSERPGDWTHALMDLGATICDPRGPDCGRCPARRWCRYVEHGSAEAGGAGAASPQGATRANGATAGCATPSGVTGADESGMHRATNHPPRRQAGRPFRETSRWLRGRIVDRLRFAPDDGWIVIDGPLGTHDGAAVSAALEALAREGLIELDGSAPTGTRRARLPVA